MNPSEQIGVYVHIPFCVRKCAYCDFLSFPADVKTQEDYVNSLCKQIDATEEKRSVASVYIGGGTPSAIDPKWIDKILCKLHRNYRIDPDAEITIEVNPGTLGDSHFAVYKSAGINRLSIGLQSSLDDELHLLGRIHTYADFLRTFQEARNAGFENINVDLMTALPGQDAEKLWHSLNCVTDLEPEHISAYSLILEEGTPFYAQRKDLDLPDEKKERALYYLMRDHLTAHGYTHYEISNFAKDGHESRHNCSYWTGQDYLGLGLGASSLLSNVRYRNETDLKSYLQDPCAREAEEVLGEKERMEEFMFLGLRMLRGIREQDFEHAFHIPVDAVYGKVVGKLLEQGLIRHENGRIFLTDSGIDYGNHVFSCFLL